MRLLARGYAVIGVDNFNDYSDVTLNRDCPLGRELMPRAVGSQFCLDLGTNSTAIASSNSVYGANTALPFAESQTVDHPVALYAATKKANELMAHSIGNSEPLQLMQYIRATESALGIKAKMNMMPLQAGDVRATAADVSRLTADTGFTPNTKIEDGVARFVAWYRDYYKV